jgi:hypothetical protein
MSSSLDSPLSINVGLQLARDLAYLALIQLPLPEYCCSISVLHHLPQQGLQPQVNSPVDFADLFLRSWLLLLTRLPVSDFILSTKSFLLTLAARWPVSMVSPTVLLIS